MEEGKGSPRFGKRAILVMALGAFLLIGGVAWLALNTGPKKPAQAPEAAGKPTTSGWAYPSEQALYSIVLDDFRLSLDGCLEITSDISEGNVGLSVGYLENKMTLDPPVPFTVEQVSTKDFLVRLENGKNLPETKVKFAGKQVGDYSAEMVVKAHFAARIVAEDGVEGAKIDAPFKVEFSDQLAAPEAVAGQISVDPPFPFTVQTQGNVATVTPGEMLNYSADYTVRVAQSVKAQTEGFALLQDSELLLHTERPDYSLTMTNQNVNTVRPDSPFKLEYQLDTTAQQGRDVNVSLFSLPGIDAYRAWLAGERGQTATPVGELRTEAMKEGLNEVVFENPGVGYYLVRTAVKDTKTGLWDTREKAIQISTASIYLQAAKGEMLLWLNDSVKGGPLAGYTVEFRSGNEKTLSAVTGADGSALLNYDVTKLQNPWNSEETKNAAATIFTVYNAAGAPVYADVTSGLSIGEPASNADRYYSFFYLDRALYRPTDTIQFWGYVKPYLKNTAPIPRTVLVTLDPQGINQQLQVPVASDGTFTGQLSYEQIVSGEYNVSAQLLLATTVIDPNTGEAVSSHLLNDTWIDVKEFQTPAYTIESTTDRLVYYHGDEVTVNITPTFFDGTPLPNYPLEFSLFDPYSGNFEATQNITTDNKGMVKATFKAGEVIADKEYSWTPKKGYYYVKLAHDGENITYQGSYVYTPADVMIRPSLELSADGAAKLTVRANKITLDRITEAAQLEGLSGGYYDADDYSASKYDVLAGEPADTQVSVRLEYSYMEPVDRSYQSKKLYKTMDIRGGKAVFEYQPEFEILKDSRVYVWSNVSYSYGGNTIASSVSAECGKNTWMDEEYKASILKGYTLAVYKNGETAPSHTVEQYLYRTSIKAGVGDTMRFALCRDGVPVKEEGGRLLYTVLQDRLVGRGYGGVDFTLVQNQRYANSVLVVAAYFDGKDVYPVQNCYVEFDQESLKLNIEAFADRETYRPGEKVTVKAKVTDQKGNPVAGNLCISVVDEAIFALREQYVNVVGSLYREMDFYNYFIYKYTTSTGDINPFNNGGDGGKGDGENLAAYDSFRKNFKDTACFYPTRSDAAGNASVTFTLPDNITSWRITTVAVGDQLFGGSAKTNFIATLPFFTKPVLSAKYIVGDEVTMLIQGHGAALSEGDQIAYTVRLTGDGVDQTFTENGLAYEPVTIKLGTLAEGEYTVTSTSTFGELRDTVELPLAVIPSNLELVVNRPLDLTKPVDIGAMRYPVVITLYDKVYAPYYKSISALLTHYSYSSEQRLARFTAKRALMEHCDPEEIPQYIRAEDGDLAVLQNADGGIGWYVGGESDPEITLNMLAVAGDQFSRDRMKRYFLTQTESTTITPVQHAAAWAGAAMLDSTYLPKLQELLNGSATLTMDEKLYYLAGMAYGGDASGAKALYETLVTPKLKTHGEETWMEYSIERTQKSDNARATAMAWLVSSKLGLPDADGFAMHFGRERWQSDSIFACMAYVQQFQKPLSGPAKCTYTSGGKTYQIDLGVMGSRAITLNRSGMEGLAFQNVPESMAASAYYIGEPEEVDIKPSDTVKLSKEFTPMDGGKYKVRVTVNFQPEAGYGYWSISDWIPSSMRLHTIARQPQSASLWIRDTQENQKLYFEFYRDESTPKTVTIEYYVQRTFDTKAVLDRTYIVCADTGENAFSERSTI